VGRTILPFYNDGPPDAYRIIISDKRVIKKENQSWINRNLRLKITSGRLVVTHIYAIQKWRPGYKEFMYEETAHYLFKDFENGDYKVDVIGFNFGGKDYGYNIVLKKIAEEI
jgi:hypothetical protein